MTTKLDLDFWKDRKVLLTGHTGFKGAWLALILKRLGAQVTGLALAPATSPNMYDCLASSLQLQSYISDIRDLASLQSAVNNIQPQIVIHMAAQALVFDAFHDPIGTIETNTMGTVNLLEALRPIETLEGILVITSDKVYENTEQGIDFDESSTLGGHEPYSASKSAAELLTSAYRRTFFDKSKIPLLTARAGNVIGGGDWSANRLIPDLWRAYVSQKPVLIRNPGSVRPWQHVLDPLYGYLLYIQHSVLASSQDYPTSLNFGPPRHPTKAVEEIAKEFSASLEASNLWTLQGEHALIKESEFLSIDSTLAYQTLGWSTALSIDNSLKYTSEWYSAYAQNKDMSVVTNIQISRFAELVGDQALSKNAH